MAPNYPLDPGLPHRFALKNHFLSGITLPAFLRLLWRHHDAVDWAYYWHRVLFLGVMSVINSLLGLVDSLLFGRAIAAQQLHPEPIIILGWVCTQGTLAGGCVFRLIHEFRLQQQWWQFVGAGTLAPGPRTSTTCWRATQGWTAAVAVAQRSMAVGSCAC
jgi:hypothetical protein